MVSTLLVMGFVLTFLEFGPRTVVKKLLAGAVAAGVLSSAGALGTGVAVADTALVVGGAKAPGIPWYWYTQMTGEHYYPDAKRVIVDYPGGMMYGRLATVLWPGKGVDATTVGESVVTGTKNLDRAIRSTSGQTHAIGLSEGTLVLDAEQARLAHDPNAPPPDQLSFTVFGDPTRVHGFSQSVLSMVPPGTYVPIVNYTVPQQVESQYDTNVVVAAYDGFGDFPDRPWNLVSLANAAIGSTTVHTPAAFTSPADVPPQNITTSINSRGGTTTTYLVPAKHLPLTLPLRYIGVSDEAADRIDDAVRPIVDAGYSRNDNPSSAPISLDPANGIDPALYLDPSSRANLDGIAEQVRSLFPGLIG
jgi:diacyltrehalose acyltransferase